MKNQQQKKQLEDLIKKQESAEGNESLIIDKKILFTWIVINKRKLDYESIKKRWCVINLSWLLVLLFAIGITLLFFGMSNL